MADTQVIIKSDGWKIKIALGLGGLTALVILAFLYRFEVGLILLVCGGVAATRLVFWAKHKHTVGKLHERQLKAQTRQLELEADKQHWEVEQQKAIAAKLVVAQYFVETKSGVFVAGDLPFKFYPSVTASRELATNQPLALPAPSLDFFEVMSDPHQAYAIVGTQRIGKSIKAQHLAQFLTTKDCLCIVVGTKANKGEWLNCKRFIGNERVIMGLSRLLAETKYRIENGINSPRIAVFLDDWLNSVALDPTLAEQFFLEAATRILTAGIVPYFLLQSDSKADWGTKHGAQLKNNFVHLLLNAPRENGRLNYDRLRATIIYPGEKQCHNVILPAGLPLMGDSEISVELAWPETTQPSEQDYKIFELHTSGKSHAAICETIWGYKSSNKYPEIDSAIERVQRAKRAN